MSGLEALGVAASIIQVADLCTKLSVRVFALYRQIRNADESVQLLSNEAALIGAILRELGDTLKEDEPCKLCSDEAFRTLGHLLDQCRDVLRQIENIISIHDRSARSRLRHVTGKLRLVLLESSLNPLKTKLERLKSTMLLLLNVIMFAGQLRNHNLPILQEQRALIETLLQEKREDGGTSSPPKHSQGQPILEWEMTENASRNSSWQSTECAELDGYNMLIRTMLREVNFCKSKLELSRHSRIRKGVLSIHDSEISRFPITHGLSALHHIDESVLDEMRTLEIPDRQSSALYAPYGDLRERMSTLNSNHLRSDSNHMCSDSNHLRSCSNHPRFSFGLSSILGLRNERRNVEPGADLVRGSYDSDDSAAVGRISTPPAGKKEDKEVPSSINTPSAFKALADLEDRGNNAMSTPRTKSDLSTSISPGLGIEHVESVGSVSDKLQDLDISRESSTAGSGAGKGGCDHDAEGYPYPDSPLAGESSLALPRDFEELLLRWTMLAQSEVQALGNPRSWI